MAAIQELNWLMKFFTLSVNGIKQRQSPMTQIELDEDKEWSSKSFSLGKAKNLNLSSYKSNAAIIIMERWSKECRWACKNQSGYFPWVWLPKNFVKNIEIWFQKFSKYSPLRKVMHTYYILSVRLRNSQKLEVINWLSITRAMYCCIYFVEKVHSLLVLFSWPLWCNNCIYIYKDKFCLSFSFNG